MLLQYYILGPHLGLLGPSTLKKVYFSVGM